MAALALTCLTRVVTQVDAPGRSGASTLGGLAAGCRLLAAFLRIEARSRHPMMPIDFFRDQAFCTAVLVGTTVNFVFYGLILMLSLFFQTVQGESAFGTGLAVVPMTALIMVVDILAGRLIGRLGPRPVELAGPGR